MTALRRRGRTRPGPWPPPFQPASDGWLLALVAAGLLLHLLVTR